MRTTIRHKVWQVLESSHHSYPSVIAVRMIIMVLIIVSVLAIVFDTVERIHHIYGGTIRIVEWFCILAFSVEYLLRLWCSAETGSRWDYFRSPLALIDIMVVLTFFLTIYFDDYELGFLRLFRLLSLLKLSRYFTPLLVLAQVIRAEGRSIMAMSLVMFILIITSASLVYYFENKVQPDVFKDIPTSIWWAAVTLSTVGYGDITPITPLGRAMSIVIMLTGIGMVALPAGLLASRFSEELQARKLKFMELAGHKKLSKVELDELAEDLSISPHDMKRILKQGETVNCPTCGQSFSINNPPPNPSGTSHI